MEEELETREATLKGLMLHYVVESPKLTVTTDMSLKLLVFGVVVGAVCEAQRINRDHCITK